MIMHILHIANSYGGTEVYKNLFTALDKAGIRQTIFVPLNAQNRQRKGNHLIDFAVEGSQIIYSTALERRHRYLYRSKISTIVSEIERSVNVGRIDFIHGHTLCVDGVAAYRLAKKYGKPFGTAVRNTDVNNYYKVFLWERPLYNKVVKSADLLFFISPSYQKLFTEGFMSASLRREKEGCIRTIPNGVNTFFVENRSHKPRNLSVPIKLIFISSFKKGKGLAELILATDRLRKEGYEVSLKAIGKGLPGRGHDLQYEEKAEALAKVRSWVELTTFLPKEQLVEEMRNADIFAMPSKPETFGLVYVEALSQGLPIIYTKGQGFDGFYPEGKVGYASTFGNVEELAEKIKSIISQYADITNRISTLDLRENFDWDVIASKYVQYYKTVTK